VFIAKSWETLNRCLLSQVSEPALWCGFSDSCLHWKKYERKLKKIEADIRYIKRCLHRCFIKKRVRKSFQKGERVVNQSSSCPRKAERMERGK